MGRRPLTSDIGLEAIEGVEVERGYVKVDEYLRTGATGMYAIGDIVPGFALAHVASHEAVVAVEHLAGHDPEPVRMDQMPRVTFCRPQIASVGMSEEEATAAGREVRTGQFPFRALGKATIVGEIDGFAKLVADAETGLLLGTHIIGPHAGDLIAEPTFAQAGGGDRGGDRHDGARASDPSRSAPGGRAGGRRGADSRLGGTMTMAKTDTKLRHGDLGLTDEDVLGMYRAMLRARAVDERMWLMQRAGKIAFIISGQGHEGAQVATTWPMRRGQDWMAPFYRSIASAMTFGMSAEDIITAHLGQGR